MVLVWGIYSLHMCTDRLCQDEMLTEKVPVTSVFQAAKANFIRVRTDLEKSLKMTLVLENSLNSKKVQFVLELSLNFEKKTP